MNLLFAHPALSFSFARSVARLLFALLLICCWSPIATAQTNSAQTAQEARLLELGKPIEREISGGQIHTYQITLTAGQYVKVEVEQRGIDVAVVLVGPDGKQIFEVNNELRIQGMETVWQVAEASGSFRLTVRATQKEAPAGRYEIRLMELRAATEQDRTLQEARKLYAEGDNLFRASKYDEALSLIERSLEMREQVLGTEHLDVAQSLNRLGTIYSSKLDYAKAESLLQRALAIREKALGADHFDVASSLNNLATLYHRKRDYAQAEVLYKRALTIQEVALGQGNPNATLLSEGNLANLYRQIKEDVKAELLFQRALVVREKAFGTESLEVVKALKELADFYKRKRDYEKAELLYNRLLAIQEKAMRPDHPDLILSLKNLGSLYEDKADYAKAELLYQRVLVILEKTLGTDHPDVAKSLEDIASLYILKFDYIKAEPLLQRALSIREKAFGANHPDVANSLIALALHYFSRGDFVKAEPLAQRALDILERVFGPDNIRVAAPLAVLGGLYRSKGDLAKSQSLIQRALVLTEKALGADNPELVGLIKDLGLLYSDKGDYAKAEPLLQRSLAIAEKTYGPNHPNVAQSISNLGDFYRAQGDYAKAEPLLQRTLTIEEKAWGDDDLRVAECLKSLTNLYRAKGEFTQSLPLQLRINTLIERIIAINLTTGSERQKLASLMFLDESDRTVSLHVEDVPRNAIARNLALTIILQRKGRALDAMTDSIAALRRRANDDDRALLNQLQETNAQLAGLVLNGPQRITLAEHQARIKSLEEQKEKLEGDISRRSAEFRAQAMPVTIEAVQAAIPAQAALAEFTSYRPFNAKYQKAEEQFGAPRYVAYVLSHQGEAQWVELGEAKPIDEAVEKLRQALRDKRRKDVKQLARAVDEKVMRPVRALLGSTTRIFISPDGALNLIPFAALVDERNRYLIQRYTFSYLTSGRDLLRLQVKQPSKQSAMVIANPDFGDDTNKTGAAKQRLLVYKPGTKAATGEGSALSNYYFPPLPGTATEARAIKTIMKDATVLAQAQATETALKHFSSPRILHIATHGFFLENQKTNAEDEQRRLKHLSLNQEMSLNLNIENPLLRSGLGLAGANLQKSGDDDGILTAQEAAGLDLWGTKLVVLSACDTGVGEVKNGEGVYGLRRALVLAGSETQVMSLWPVSDLGTRDLMIGYYKRLLAGQGRTEALRNTQLEMLRSGLRGGNETSRLLVRKGQTNSANSGKKDRSHPYYWASFIQSGEWANLDGKR